MKNLVKFIYKIFKKNTGIISLPFKLNLYLTNQCNCRCKICNIWKKNTMNELKTADWDKFFSLNNYFSWIDIAGGEIFLRNDIQKIFDIIIKRCSELYLIHFATNGILTNKIYDNVLYLKKIFKGKIIITVSLDGIRSIHDNLRGRPGTYDSAIETYKRLKDISESQTHIGYTISKYNAGKLPEFINDLKKTLNNFQLENLHLNLCQTSAIYYSNQNIDHNPSRPEYSKDINYYIKQIKLPTNILQYLEKKYLKKLIKYNKNLIYPFSSCGALNSTITINPYGEVYPCQFYDKALGALDSANYNLNEILYSPMAKKLKKNILHRCPGCWTACEAFPSLISHIY